MKRFRVRNRETDDWWIVALPEVNIGGEAVAHVAQKFNQNRLDLYAIRVDSGERQTVAKGNGLALERCSSWGNDPAHEEDCWRVVKYREEGHPEVVSHVRYREAMALVMDIPLEEIERRCAELERQTPEEEQAWWDAFNKEEKDR